MLSNHENSPEDLSIRRSVKIEPVNEDIENFIQNEREAHEANQDCSLVKL